MSDQKDDKKKWSIPVDTAFSEVLYVCRPCSHEDKHNLWHKWHYLYGVSWDDESRGRTIQIGEINDRPIVVTVWWARIQMEKVAFVDACSQLVDYKMVDDWCSDVFPAARHWSNPTNFHNIIGPIKCASRGIYMRDVSEIDKLINSVPTRWIPEDK